MRILAVDAGNSRIKWGVHDAGGWAAQSWAATAEAHSLAATWDRLPRPELVIAANVAGAAVEEVLADSRWGRSTDRPYRHAANSAALLRDGPLSQGKIAFAWSAVVGPAVQRATAVHLEGDILIVDAASAQWGREVARSSPMILRRLQALLGADAVREISVRR